MKNIWLSSVLGLIVVFCGCDMLKVERTTTVCDVPEGKTSVLCQISKAVDFDLEDIQNILVDAHQMAMMSGYYNPERMLRHFEFVETMLCYDGHNVAPMSYRWFFDVIFDDVTKKLFIGDMLDRRFSEFRVETLITDYDKKLLQISITALKEQAVIFKAINE